MTLGTSICQPPVSTKFSLIFLSYCEQGNFETNIIERDAYDSLLRCNFRYIGIAKKKKKGLRVLKKGCMQTAWATVSSTFFFQLPLTTVWVKVSFIFLPLNLLSSS
jgi:hypothetical protein